jgi:hypothetical protein
MMPQNLSYSLLATSFGLYAGLLSFVQEAQSCQPRLPSNPASQDRKVSPTTRDDVITPQTLTFPQMVQITPLKQANPPNGHHEEISFSTQPNVPHSIQINEMGALKLRFVSGPHFQIIDGDGRDGQATIQVPNGVMDTYFRAVEGAPGGTVEISDPLYYSKSRLGKDPKTWFRLGKRPFPMPEKWLSANGKDWVLTMSNQGVNGFQMRLTYATAPAPFPPGINEIGPEGGVVELPGVGKLEIPPGAVDRRRVIRMLQELHAPEILYLAPCTNRYVRQKDFISPIIRLEPFHLHLLKPAVLYLKTDLNRLGNNAPGYISWYTTNTLLEDKWGINKVKSDDLELYQYKPNMAAIVEEFSYFAKVIDANVTPTSAGKIAPPVSEKDIQLAPEVLKELEGVDTKQIDELYKRLKDAAEKELEQAKKHSDK